MATLKQLATFLMVAETLQMSEAAKILYLSQSTVSQTILDLEAEFGAALFQRGHRQMALTPKGMLFREQAQRVMDGYEELTHIMEKSQGIRELRLGATLTIGNTQMADILARLRLDHPDIWHYLYVENTRLLEARLLHHEVDICLIEGVIASENLEKLQVAEDELRLVCGRGHPFWGREYIEPEELSRQPFILREQGSGTRRIFESTMRAAQISPQVVGESVSSTAIMKLVSFNLGMGVLSCRCIRQAVQEGTLWALSVRGCPMHRYFQVCYHKHRPITSQMRDFIAAARTVLNQE